MNKSILMLDKEIWTDGWDITFYSLESVDEFRGGYRSGYLGFTQTRLSCLYILSLMRVKETDCRTISKFLDHFSSVGTKT